MNTWTQLNLELTAGTMGATWHYFTLAGEDRFRRKTSNYDWQFKDPHGVWRNIDTTRSFTPPPC